MSDTYDVLETLTGDDKIVREALTRLEYCSNREGECRKLFLEDIKFANADSNNGYQWPNDIQTNRNCEKRPCLTINKTHQHNLQIINDAKQNKASIKIRPVGNESTYEAAEVYEGIIRHIEYISNASDAYDTGVKFQVEGGIGYWRVVTDYIGDDTFDQEIYIRRIKDPLSVFLDPDINEIDGSDAMFGFVFTDMKREMAREKYPKFKDMMGQNALGNSDNWIDDHHVRVCEYFRRVKKTDRLITFQHPDTGIQHTMRESKLPPKIAKAVIDDPISQCRGIEDYEVEWFLFIGNKIADRRIWPGTTIPLVRCIGEETIIDGKIDRKGHTRAMKDPQRIYNYWSPLALDTPLPTPSGWTTMEAVRAGDWLLDESGNPVEVSGVSPVFIRRKCYRVNFDDGSHIVADAEHKWTVEERGKAIMGGWEWLDKTVSTAELTPKKHFIKTTKPLDLPDIELPIDPYLLGVWLGDGDSMCARICAGAFDIEEMRENIISLNTPYNIGVARMYRDRSAGVFTVHGLLSSLQKLGLVGNKHIPEIYLRASRKQREALLQGLMDTDGSISARKQCDFTNTNNAIAFGFSELLRSVGIKAVFCRRKATRRMFPSGKEYACQEATQFSFSADPDQPVFRLKRKFNVQTQDRITHWRRTKRHRINSVVEVQSVPVKCVAINSASHLFLAGEGMVPTHNSAAVEFVALQGKTPFVGAAAAIEGNETYWREANVKNFSILPYKHVDDDGNPIPPPTRAEAPVFAPAYVQGMQVAQAEMAMVSGQYEATFGEKSNERSGRAINERARQGDRATYHFIDNQAIAIRRTGKIIIELIPKIYDTKREINILANDGVPSRVTIDPEAKQSYLIKRKQEAEEVAQIMINPNIGRYDVQADVGPAYATRRQEAFNALSQILSQSSELVPLVGDLLFKAADFPMAEEVAERLERMVPPQAKGEGMTPAVQQMQMQLKQMQGSIAALIGQLAEEKSKVKAKDQQKEIDVYEAITKRIEVLLKNVIVTPKDNATMLHDLMVEEHASSLRQAEAASAPDLQAEAQNV